MSHWEEDEWYRRVNPLVDVIYEFGQEDFFNEYDIYDEIAKNEIVSALYIFYCNRKGLKQKPKILKAKVSSGLPNEKNMTYNINYRNY